MWSDKKGPIGPEKGPIGPDFKKGPIGPEKGPIGPEKGSIGPRSPPEFRSGPGSGRFLGDPVRSGFLTIFYRIPDL